MAQFSSIFKGKLALAWTAKFIQLS